MLKPTSQKRELLAHTLKKVFLGVFAVVMISGLWLSVTTGQTTAATNSTINFQAKLESSSGAIAPDGNYNVEFKLYNAATSSGSSQGSCTGDANCLWTETRTGANVVHVANGYLAVNLGSVTALPTTINWDQQLWLTMNIGGTGTPTWDGEMNPRLQLTAVPYAFKAGQLAQYNSSTTFTSTLSLQNPTIGNQSFVIPDQAAAGTYNLCIQGSSSCGFAASSGSGSYIDNQLTQQTSANFNIDGTGKAANFNATTALQTAGVTRVDASGNLTNIGNISGSGTLQLSGTTGSSYIMSALGLGTTSPQSGSALTLANGSWIASLDSAGTGYVNMFQVNSNNEIQVGAALNIDGGIVLPTDGGQLTFSDLPVDSSASSGTKESYTMRVGTTNALTIYGEADGSGGIQNVRVAIGAGISPQYSLDVTGDVNATGVYRSNGTAGLTSTSCTGGNVLQNAVVQGGIVTGGTCVANGGGVAPTLQDAYGNSTGGTTPEIVLDSTRTTVDIQGYSGQTADLLDLRSYTATGLGTLQFGVDPNGNATANGVVTAAALQGVSLDTASAGTLNIGLASGGNATSITLNQNTTVASGKTLTVNGSGFDANGNLGIGTTGPSANLDIQSAATTSNALNVTADSLTTGNALNVTVNSANTSSGNLANLIQGGTYTDASPNLSGSLLNASRAITANNSMSGPVGFDQVTYAESSGSYTITFAAAVASHNNRYLVVAVYSNCTVIGATYNGVTMSNLGSTVGSTLSLWGLAAPSVGTNNVVVTALSSCSSDYYQVTASSWYNVSQGSPIGTVSTSSGSSSTASISATTQSNQTVMGVVAEPFSSSAGEGSGQTQIYKQYSASLDKTVAGAYKSSSGTSTSMTWGSSNATWHTGAIPLNPAQFVVSGSVANLSSDCTITAGSCADSSSILNLNQQYASATGTVLNIQNAGTGDMLDLANGSGTVLASFDSSGNLTVPTVNAITGYSINGTPGLSITACTSGDVLGNIAVTGGIITGGSCAANGGGIAPTLQDAYNNSGVTNPQIQLSSTNGGLKIRDASTTVGNILQVQNNAGTTTYFAVTANGLQAGSLDTVSSGTLTIGGTNATNITVGTTSSTGTITLGQSSATNTINIGSANLSGSNVQTINIGAPSGGSGYENITIGKADTASVASINGGVVSLTGNNGISLNVNGTGGGGAVVKTVTNNSTTALQIQNASGSSGVLFNADTQNMRISIGNIGTATGQLYVGGRVPADVSSGGVVTGNTPDSVAVSGHYAYVTSRAANKLQVFNISNPASPVDVSSGGATTAAAPEKVVVSGRYAFVVDNTANKLQVFDISNPASPVDVSSGGATTAAGPESVTISGHYAYVVSDAASGPSKLQVFDISNPASPVDVSSGGVATNNYPWDIAVSGRYAYVVSSTTGKLQVFDLGGAYIQQLEAGGAEFGTLQVDNNAQFGNNVSIQGGVNIGQSLQIASNVGVGGQLTANTGLTIGTGGNFVNGGSTLNSSKALSLGSSGAIGTAAATVDAYTTFDITATAGSLSFTLPSPTVTTSGRVVYINNVGATNSFVINGATLGTGTSANFIWNGTAWTTTAVSTGVSLVGTYSTSNTAAGGATISGNSIIFQSASASAPGMVDTGNQTFAGAKTFRGNTTISNSSSTGFVIQNTTPTALFTADTSAMRVSIGSIGTPTGQLYVSGAALSASSVVDSIATASSLHPNGIAISGHYAYVPLGAFGDNGYLQVIDITNPANLTQAGVSAVQTSDPTGSIKISGHYAYTASFYGGDINIFDISNPSAPVKVGTITATYSQPSVVGVQGRYVYTVSNGGNGYEIFDVSNPASPKSVHAGSLAAGSSAGFVQGNYFYISVNNTLEILNVSNPASPSVAGSVAVTGAGDLYVDGRYAYVNTVSSLQVVDVSNPASPSTAGMGSIAVTGGGDVYKQGRYIYTTTGTNDHLYVVNVSNPTSLTMATSVNLTGTIDNAGGIGIAGRYAYIASVYGNAVYSIDLGGAYIQQLETGGLETGSLQVDNNASFAADASIQGGLTVGQSLQVSGDISTSGSLKVAANNSSTSTAMATLLQGGTGDATISVGNASQSYYVGVDTSNSNAFSINSLTSATTGAPATITFIQSNGSASDTSLGTIAQAYTSNTAAGNLLVAMVAWHGNTTMTCSDTLGNSFTTVDTTYDSGNAQSNAICYAPNNKSSAADTITATFGTATTFRRILVAEYSGVATSSPVDVVAGNVASGTTGTDNITSTSATTTQDGDLIFGGVEDTTGTTTITAGTGFTQRKSVTTTDSTAIQGKVQSTAGPVASTQTFSNAHTYIATMVAFKANTSTSFTDSYTHSLLTLSQTGALKLQNVVNSTSAFQIQNTSAASLLTADTANMRINIGSLGKAAGQLYVSGVLPASTLSSVSTGASTGPNGIVAQGSYLYVANQTSSTLQVINASNPAALSLAGSVSTGSGNGAQYLAVQGHYAYVVNTTNGSLAIVDISNPASPTLMGTPFVMGNNQPKHIVVSGRYAYIAAYSGSKIFVVDVSNPAAPSLVSTTSTSGSPYGVALSGKYLYVTQNTAATMEIFDVSNPASLVEVTTARAVLTTSGAPRGAAVQGRYVYVANSGATTSSTMQVVDVSNPATPTVVGTVAVASGAKPDDVVVQGHYAFIVNTSGNTMQIIDVTDPTSPQSLGTVSTGGTGPVSLAVQGRYAYVTNETTNTVVSYDLGGAYVQQLHTGGLETGTLLVDSSASFAGDATIQGGLSIGQSLQVGSSIGTAGSVTLGTSLVFGNSSNANTVTLSAGATTSSYSLSLPTNAPGTSQCLQTDGSDPTKLVFVGCTGGSGSGVTAVGGIDGGTYSDNGAYINNTTNTIYLQSAGASSTGLVTHGAQTFGGAKTFNSATTVDTASSTALLIQNTSSNVLFAADTSSMALSLGASNTKLGYTTQGGTNDSADRNHVDAMRFLSGTGGSVTSVSVYVGSIDPTTANDKYEVAIYGDSGGAISGAALATSAQGTLVANSWNTISISASLTANTPYWIAYNTNASGNSYNNLIYDSSVAGSVVAYMTQTYGTWPTITTGTATPAPGYAFSMYATITPSTTGAIHTNSAGNTTFTGNVGIGMAPDASTLTGNALNVGGSASITDDSSPQLTLLQSAGNKTTLQTDSSGNFALTSSGTTITLQSSATTTTIVNDGFTAGSLDAAWTVTTPAGATATYDNTGTGHEDLSLIANSNDDCWSTGFNCATVLRTYTDVNRTYEVKIDSMTLPSGTGNSEGMGIMLYGDNSNFIRFELRGSTTGNSVTCYVIIGGVGYTNACQQPNLTVTNPLYLRVVNTGNNYYEYVSQDGSTWTLMNQMNDVQVGGSALTVTKAGFYIDGGSASKASSGNFDYFKTTALVNPLTLQVNGNISAEGAITTGADYAEYYNQAVPGQLNVGDLACLAGPQTVAACGPGGTIVGAVSAHPGYIGNSKAYDKNHPENTALVGMMGQIPVKYDTSGGTINIGDPIGISTTAGVATKEVGAGQIVGYALENSTNTSGGTIMVLVRPQYYTPANSDTLQGGNALFNQITISGTANFGGDINVSGAAIVGTLKVTGDATVGGDLTINGKTIVKDLIINGHLITGGNAPALTADGAAIGHFGVVTLNGNDTAGTITVRVDIDGDGDPDKSTPVDLNGDGKPDPLPTLTAGQLFTVTFNKPYDTGSTPRIVISPANADAAHMQTYVDGGDSPNTHFDLWSLQSLQDGKTYVFNYFVVQ